MKLLFIAPIFYDYEKSIKKILDTRYERVIFRAEIPCGSPNKYYALRRFNKFLAKTILDNYNCKLAKLVENEKIERIFIIRGCGLNEYFFRTIRALGYPIEIFHYQWDSLHNNPNGEMISRYADYNFSFDLNDTYVNPRFRHLPLFYVWDLLSDRITPDNYKQDIDILFVGGYHSERHVVVGKVQAECNRLKLILKSHIYLFIGSYLRDRLTTKKINYDDVCLKKISREDYYKLLCRSRVVLDIQSPTQSGATMRTIETLSLGRKLLSTNLMLKKELFYTPHNIQIWNPDEPLNIDKLLKGNFDHSKDLYIRSLDEWLEVIGV